LCKVALVIHVFWVGNKVQDCLAVIALSLFFINPKPYCPRLRSGIVRSKERSGRTYDPSRNPDSKSLQRYPYNSRTKRSTAMVVILLWSAYRDLYNEHTFYWRHKKTLNPHNSRTTRSTAMVVMYLWSTYRDISNEHTIHCIHKKTLNPYNSRTTRSTAMVVVLVKHLPRPF